MRVPNPTNSRITINKGIKRLRIGCFWIGLEEKTSKGTGSSNIFLAKRRERVGVEFCSLWAYWHVHAIVREPDISQRQHGQGKLEQREPLTDKLGLNGLAQLTLLDHAISGLLSSKHHIEIRHVHWTANARLERRLDLLLQQSLEIDVLSEELVPFDFFSPIDSKALRRVSIQKPGEDRTRQGTDFVRGDKRIVKDLLVHLIGDLCGKGQKMRCDCVPRLRRDTNHRRVEAVQPTSRTAARQASTNQSPCPYRSVQPSNQAPREQKWWLTVSLTVQNFRGQVLGGSAKRVRHV